VKAETKGPITIRMLLGKLIKHSFARWRRRSCECLLLGNNLSILLVDFLRPIDFALRVELNDGFDINMLVFRYQLVVRVDRI
jgi:hypothetical protein